jgi:hypothetical protein
MKIRFISDYLGRETAMQQYRRGAVADFDNNFALELIKMELAVEIVETKPEPIKPRKEKEVYHDPHA